MNRIEVVSQIIREMMVGNAPGESEGFTSSGDSKTVAGYDPLMPRVDLRKHRKSHRPWIRSLNK